MKWKATVGLGGRQMTSLATDEPNEILHEIEIDGRRFVIRTFNAGETQDSQEVEIVEYPDGEAPGIIRASAFVELPFSCGIGYQSGTLAVMWGVHPHRQMITYAAAQPDFLRRDITP